MSAAEKDFLTDDKISDDIINSNNNNNNNNNSKALNVDSTVSSDDEFTGEKKDEKFKNNTDIKVYISKDHHASSDKIDFIGAVDEDDIQNENGREPTEEELSTLRHVSERIPFTCWLIAIVELAERFSYYGLSAPFQNYMQNGPNDTPKGVLQLKSQGATALSYFFQFWCYVTPLLGGYLADTFWGKYNTICVGASFYVVGILILFMTAIPSINDKNSSLGGFIVSLIIIGIGTGFIKANLSVLIADQIPKTRPRIKVLKNGEKVIEDPNVTMQNVFMFFYLMINIGSLSVMATTHLEASYGFWAAYLLTFCFFWVGIVVLVFGRKKYVRRPIGDHVIARCFKICWIGLCNGFNLNRAVPSLNPEKEYPWNDLFIDEIRRAFKACKVFAFYPIYWVVYGQMLNNFVTQAGTMELHGLPNDFLQAINSIALIVFIPIMEQFIYPFIRRFTPFRPVTKIFIGFCFGSSAMVYAAVLQHFIYKAGPCYDFPMSCAPEYANTPNRVHIGWQVPAYVLISLSEIFASITGLEYAYSKAPATMKAFIMSIFLVTNAVGSALGIALSPTAENPKYVWTFSGLAVACFIAGCLFWLCFHHYNKDEEALNALDYKTEEQEQMLSGVGVTGEGAALYSVSSVRSRVQQQQKQQNLEHQLSRSA